MNEPAFPQPINPAEYGRGMTLRDYFAAKAMQGFCANNNTNAQEIAQAAYIVANNMLKERMK